MSEVLSSETNKIRIEVVERAISVAKVQTFNLLIYLIYSSLYSNYIIISYICKQLLLTETMILFRKFNKTPLYLCVTCWLAFCQQCLSDNFIF